MKTGKLKEKILCFFLLVAMVITLLPTIAFANGEKTISVSYQSVGMYGSGGTYSVNGGASGKMQGWFEIQTTDGGTVTFNLTPPTRQYPASAGEVTPFVFINGVDVTASKVSGNSFTVNAKDFPEDSNSMNVEVFWSKMEKDYYTLSALGAGRFVMDISCNGDDVGFSVLTGNIENQAGFGTRKKLFVTPESEIVELSITGGPDRLEVNDGQQFMNNLMENPTVNDADGKPMIEYDKAAQTVTFHTNVGKLQDYLTGESGRRYGIGGTTPNINIDKRGGSGPMVNSRVIFPKEGYIVFDPATKEPYLKYAIPYDAFTFENIPTGDPSHPTTRGSYSDLTNQGYIIEFTNWPEQASIGEALKSGDFIQYEVDVEKDPIKVHLMGSASLRSQIGNLTKFEVSGTTELIENYDGLLNPEGDYFEYMYKDKAKFNVTLESDGPGGHVVDEFVDKTMADMQNCPIQGTDLLVSDTQKAEHWTAGHTYDVYYCLEGQIQKGSVKIVASEYSEEYWQKLAETAIGEIAPGNKVTLKSIEPKDASEANVIFENVFSAVYDEQYKDSKLKFVMIPDANDLSKGTINVFRTFDYGNPILVKTFQNISIDYVFDKDVKAVVDTFKDNFKSFDYESMGGPEGPPAQLYGNVYLITDLDAVNMCINGNLRPGNENKKIDFSSEYLNTTNRNNIISKLSVATGQFWDGRFGFCSYGCGKLALIYDGTVYGLVDKVGYISANILYVPTDTGSGELEEEARIEAFKAAALKRLKEYLGDDQEIEVQVDDHYTSMYRPSAVNGFSPKGLDEARAKNFIRKAFSVDPDERSTELLESHSVDKVFTIHYNDKGYFPFWIVADSSKMQDMSSAYMKSVDIKTGTTVETDTDATIPLDTKITATEYPENDSKGIHLGQLKKLGLDEGVVYGLDLNSAIREGLVTKTNLKNGFKVKMRLPASYEGKAIKAYYVAEDGTIEEHEATVVKEGNKYFATFTTDHFSIYTIGSALKTPKASDFDFTAPESLTYDGKAKTAKVEIKSGVSGMGAVTVEYYKDGKKVDAAIDAGDYTVKINVAAGANYGEATRLTDESWKFTVTKRDVIITSCDAEKAYDGKALTNEKVEESGDGFIKGEGAEYTFTGKQENVGVSSNVFTYQLKDGTSAGNYDIVQKFGTLSVKSSKKEDVTVDDGALKEILDKYAKDEKYKGKTLGVELKANGKVDEADAKLIKANTGTKKITMIDIQLILDVDGDAFDIGGENTKLIRFGLNFDLKNKKDVQILRVHEGEIGELKEQPNALGEFIKIDTENSKIIICACQYSTYAITYNETENVETGDSSNMMIWLIAMAGALAAAGMAGSVLYRRKKN